MDEISVLKMAEPTIFNKIYSYPSLQTYDFVFLDVTAIEGSRKLVPRGTL